VGVLGVALQAHRPMQPRLPKSRPMPAATPPSRP
jgi:hypothetical protein